MAIVSYSYMIIEFCSKYSGRQVCRYCDIA